MRGWVEAARAARRMAGAGLALSLLTTAAMAQTASFRPVTDAMIQNPDASDWLSFRRTVNGWGYSPLDQINAGNVKGLKEAWSRPLAGAMMEATPLVHDGVMFLPLPGDKIVAVDAATGKEIWSFARTYPQGAQPGVTKRNLAIWDNYLYSTSGDGALFAVDARSGKQVWEVHLTGKGTNVSTGPIIADGKVISTRACLPATGPEDCVIVANDARTGKELWRQWTIAKPGTSEDASWGGVPWEKRNQVGAWMPPTYDPQLKLLYVGTTVTGPTTKYKLAGADKDYLYHDSTLALDPATGKIVWHYQHMVDEWDFDHPFERLLIDTEVAPDPAAVSWINPRIKPGETRQVLTGIPGKSGIIYTLDRKTGEFLWARPTVQQNIVSSIDGATGKVTMNPATIFAHDDEFLHVCPAFTGGKNWPPGAYSPKTGLMYMPLENLCSTVNSGGPKSGPGQLSMNIDYKAEEIPGEPNIGTVQAISVKTGRTAWNHKQRAGAMSTVATGGDLVFYGDAMGGFHALNASTGEELWQAKFNGALSGVPVTFSAGGKQYVAVATGPSPEAMGLGRMTPDLSVGTERVLHVFALP